MVVLNSPWSARIYWSMVNHGLIYDHGQSWLLRWRIHGNHGLPWCKAHPTIVYSFSNGRKTVNNQSIEWWTMTTMINHGSKFWQRISYLTQHKFFLIMIPGDSFETILCEQICWGLEFRWVNVMTIKISKFLLKSQLLK